MKKNKVTKMKPEVVPDCDFDARSWTDNEEDNKRCTENLNNHTWDVVGIRATAVLEIPYGNGGCILQKITSPGIWGFVHDPTDKDALKDLEAYKQEELETLKHMLKQLNAKV